MLAAIAFAMRRALPVCLAVGGVLLFVLGLHWPLPLHALDWHAPSAFGGGHVWAFQMIERMVAGDLPLRLESNHLGFPITRSARFIGWFPALLALPLQRLLGPVGAFHAVLWLSPSLAALAAYGWLRQATPGSRGLAAAAASLYALSPYMLSNLAAGNVDKLQTAFYPAWLALVWWMLASPGRLRVLVLLPLLGAAMAFTEPYFALFLPLFAAPMLGARAWKERDRAMAQRGFAALVATGLGVFPAAWYYGPTQQDGQLFQPADGKMNIGVLQDVDASPWKLLFGSPERIQSATEVLHAPAVGVALVLLAVLVSTRAFRGRLAGLVLAAAGLVLVLGTEQGGLPMPMALLEALGYPLGIGGQYYRASPVLTLGLLTLVAGGLGRQERWVAALVPLQLVQALWITGPFWPRPAQPIAGLEVLEAMQELGQPFEGVATLPVSSSQVQNDVRIVGAAIHRHPSTVLPRHAEDPTSSAEYAWAWEVAEEGVPALNRGGLRLVLLYRTMDPGLDPPALQEPALRELLGEPDLEDEHLLAWEVPVSAGSGARRPGSHPRPGGP
mgnify:CR=1 FL=1